MNDYLLLFDGTKSLALYDFKNDLKLQNNIILQFPDQVKKMEEKFLVASISTMKYGVWVLTKQLKLSFLET